MCIARGLDYNRFLEGAIKEALAEVRYRKNLGNGRSTLRLLEFHLSTRDEELLAIGGIVASSFSLYGSDRFDRIINRKIERKVTLCELRSSSSS